MMIDVSKESSGRVLLGHIIYIFKFHSPWSFIFDVQQKWVKIASEYSLALSTL